MQNLGSRKTEPIASGLLMQDNVGYTAHGQKLHF